jgi:hypothetical protein
MKKSLILILVTVLILITVCPQAVKAAYGIPEKNEDRTLGFVLFIVAIGSADVIVVIVLILLNIRKKRRRVVFQDEQQQSYMQYKFCSSCGTLLPPNSSICTKCGKEETEITGK